MTTGKVITASGRALSKTDLDRLADKAEEGFDLSTWKPRRGRPSLSAAGGGHSPRIEARVPDALHRRVSARAASEGKSVSAVVRQLLEEYARDC
ncbi:MAG TPA: ribbon-helix-helix protein, CopG family [Candidatus Limnocylindrales bacterium]